MTNVGPTVSIYTVRIESPPGENVAVDPPVLAFTSSSTKKLKFKVKVCPRLKSTRELLLWKFILGKDGFHVVKIPLMVRPVVDELCTENWS